jgi:hypothetical protein
VGTFTANTCACHCLITPTPPHIRHDRSMTSSNCSKSAENRRTPATSSSATTSTGAISASKCVSPAAPDSSFLTCADPCHAVCTLSMDAQDFVPRFVLPPSWEPRVPISDRALHIQARMQPQVLRARVRGVPTVLLRTSASRNHEQKIPLHTWRVVSRAAHTG